MTDLERVAAEQSASRFATNNCSQPVLGSESGNHLAGTGTVLVYQERDPTVKALRTLFLRVHGDRAAVESEPKDERNQPRFPIRDTVEDGSRVLSNCGRSMSFRVTL